MVSDGKICFWMVAISAFLIYDHSYAYCQKASDLEPKTLIQKYIV